MKDGLGSEHTLKASDGRRYRRIREPYVRWCGEEGEGNPASCQVRRFCADSITRAWLSIQLDFQ